MNHETAMAAKGDAAARCMILSAPISIKENLPYAGEGQKLLFCSIYDHLPQEKQPEINDLIVGLFGFIYPIQ